MPFIATSIVTGVLPIGSPSAKQVKGRSAEISATIDVMIEEGLFTRACDLGTKILTDLDTDLDILRSGLG